jgi:RNA polymerase sigma-70 factor (ECF subfamily)
VSSAEASDDEFERFFVTEFDAVVRSLAGSIGDREAAVDAAQEAFIKAHANWATVREYEAPAAWVRRIAINASRDRLRSDRRRRDREASLAESARVDTNDGGDDAHELLDELSPRQRDVAALYYLEDRSVDDIAARLGLSTGTVKSHLSDARQRLRRHHRR